MITLILNHYLEQYSIVLAGHLKVLILWMAQGDG